MNIDVIGGVLYQWDTGRKIKIEPPEDKTVNEVHFALAGSTDTLNVYPKDEDGEITANIPNIILQSSGVFIVYAVMVSEDGVQTVFSRSFSIVARPKPDDYVYTEEDVLRYETLVKRLDDIEANGVPDIDSGLFLPSVGEADNGKVLTVVGGKWTAQEAEEPGVAFETDETLTLENGVLSVNTATDVEADNTLPITAAAVHATVGNIEVLLETI